MNRGDIVWVELHPRSGSEQQGHRPAVIMSHDGFNETKTWRSVIVIPLSTSPKQLLRGITVVRIPKGVADLKAESAALCHQITTLDRAKIGVYIGTLPKAYIQKIEGGLKAALDME